MDAEDIGWGKLFRVKLEIDLKKSLARSRTIFVNGSRLWIPIRYEKLP